MTGIAACTILTAALVALPSPTAARDNNNLPDISPARLHLRLLRAEPAIRSTVVGSPAAIRLWFSEPVRLKATSVKVTNSAGIAIALGQLSRDTAGKAPVVANVAKPMAPGHYLVAWRAMGHDSHVVKDTFSFTVAAAKPKAGR